MYFTYLSMLCNIDVCAYMYHGFKTLLIFGDTYLKMSKTMSLLNSFQMGYPIS